MYIGKGKESECVSRSFHSINGEVVELSVVVAGIVLVVVVVGGGGG
jgi:hypothetical protein